MVAHFFVHLFSVSHNFLHHFPIFFFLYLHAVFINQDIGLAAAEKARFGMADAGFPVREFRPSAQHVFQPFARRTHFADSFGRGGQQREHDGCGGGNHKCAGGNQEFGRRRENKCPRNHQCRHDEAVERNHNVGFGCRQCEQLHFRAHGVAEHGFHAFGRAYFADAAFGVAFFAFAFFRGLRFGRRLGCLGIRTVGLMFRLVVGNAFDTVFRRPTAVVCRFGLEWGLVRKFRVFRQVVWDIFHHSYALRKNKEFKSFHYHLSIVKHKGPGGRYFRRPHAISAVGKISYNDGLFIL